MYMSSVVNEGCWEETKTWGKEKLQTFIFYYLSTRKKAKGRGRDVHTHKSPSQTIAEFLPPIENMWKSLQFSTLTKPRKTNDLVSDKWAITGVWVFSTVVQAGYLHTCVASQNQWRSESVKGGREKQSSSKRQHTYIKKYIDSHWPNQCEESQTPTFLI